jgi:glycosyltransferase involved in cell wall biosynthesis
MSHFFMLSQVYPPDAAAVGQHFEDAAVRLAQRGHRITVYTADRDYDNPSVKYDSTSRHSNVRIVRLPFTSFGKRTILHRLLGQGLYLLQVFFCLLFKRNVDGVVLTTIPATTGLMYLVLRAIRRFPTLYWVMDVNPDQAVALGAFRENSLSVNLLNAANARLIRGSKSVVVLDRYMRQRILRKHAIQDHQCGKVETIPPWPLSAHLRPIPREENSFVTAHHLEGKQCIFMYSGNHSLVHPLDTLLEAIRGKKQRKELAFLFVGGGRGKQSVEAYIENERPVNVRSLPYQPLESLSFSLSAADVQIVVMGEKMVGIVHPCKIYGAMAVGKPVLFIGPKESHLGELVSLHGFGWVVEHGDVEGLSGLIDEIGAMPRAELEAMGAKGKALIDSTYSAELLTGRFCKLVEGLSESNV